MYYVLLCSLLLCSVLFELCLMVFCVMFGLSPQFNFVPLTFVSLCYELLWSALLRSLLFCSNPILLCFRLLFLPMFCIALVCSSSFPSASLYCNYFIDRFSFCSFCSSLDSLCSSTIYLINFYSVFFHSSELFYHFMLCFALYCVYLIHSALFCFTVLCSLLICSAMFPSALQNFILTLFKSVLLFSSC